MPSTERRQGDVNLVAANTKPDLARSVSLLAPPGPSAFASGERLSDQTRPAHIVPATPPRLDAERSPFT